MMKINNVQPKQIRVNQC